MRWLRGLAVLGLVTASCMVGSGSWELEEEDGGEVWSLTVPPQVPYGRLYINHGDDGGGVEDSAVEDGGVEDVSGEEDADELDVEGEVEVGSDADADGDGDADSDGEVDVTVEAEAEVEAGADADADADADGDTTYDAEAEAEAGPVTWYDSTSGLLWEQDIQLFPYRTWDEATTYCNDLVLGGHNDWHLPSISQLRTLIRSCSVTMTGGPCTITDSCLASSCYIAPSCDGCTRYAGPGFEGCYWDPALTGPCTWYWSSSTNTTDPFKAWFLSPGGGYMFYNSKTSQANVRCVRYGM